MIKKLIVIVGVFHLLLGRRLRKLKAQNGIERFLKPFRAARASHQNDETEESKRKKRGEGEGESGAAGTATTYVRASGEGIVRLSVEQTKKVWADFRHLDLNEVVGAVAEFFSEFPARASVGA